MSGSFFILEEITHDNGVAASISLLAFLPKTSGKKRGISPKLGRTERIFSSLKISPFFTSAQTYSERAFFLAFFCASLSSYLSLPRAFSRLRICSHIEANSLASIEKALSCPPSLRFKVRCFLRIIYL